MGRARVGFHGFRVTGRVWVNDVLGRPPECMLTVVTLCRNNVEGLKRTHSSLADWIEHPRTRWMVVDGGSTDGSIELARSLTPNVLVANDGGIYFGMNRALAETEAEWVWFLNAGDVAHEDASPYRIVSSLAGLKPESTLAYGDAMELVDGVWYMKKARRPEHHYRGMFTHHQSLFFRVTEARMVGYPTVFEIAADYAHVLAILRRGEAPPDYLGVVVARFEGGGLSHANPIRGRREQAMIKRLSGYPRRVVWPTYVRQLLAWRLRRLAPVVYGKLLSRRRAVP